MAMAMAGRLGTMLVSSGLITEDQLKQALAHRRRRPHANVLIAKQAVVHGDFDLVAEPFHEPGANMGHHRVAGPGVAQ